MPEDASIVPTARLLLLHVPTNEASLKVTDIPWHTPATPVILKGSGFTVITVVVLHPVVKA